MRKLSARKKGRDLTPIDRFGQALLGWHDLPGAKSKVHWSILTSAAQKAALVIAHFSAGAHTSIEDSGEGFTCEHTRTYAGKVMAALASTVNDFRKIPENSIDPRTVVRNRKAAAKRVTRVPVNSALKPQTTPPSVIAP